MRLESIHLQWPQHTSCSWGITLTTVALPGEEAASEVSPNDTCISQQLSDIACHIRACIVCVCVCMCFTASVNGVGGASGVFGAASASNHYRNEAVW